MKNSQDKKSFLNVSNEECLHLYPEMISSSDKQWASAEHLAKLNDFGTAISVSIISVEELIKALVIFLDGKGFKFRSIKGIDTLFRHHQLRYFIAYALFVVNVFAEDIFKFLRKIQKNPELISELGQQFKEENRASLDRKVKFYFLKKLIVLRREAIWFAQIKLFREQGFYSDFDENLKSPISISEKEYHEIMERLEKVRTIIKGIIEAYEQTDRKTIELQTFAQQEFIKDDLYTQIENSLSNLKKDSKNPFNTLIDLWN